MKKLPTILKNFILGAFILYGYNLIAVNFNMMIPINIFTLFGLTFLGAPALVAFILFKIFVL